jgi:AcrR family transcriptional regulator
MTIGHYNAAVTKNRLREQKTGGGRVAAKRELILRGAMHLFADVGFHAARMDDLAADLGIAKGSIFQHFGSKQGLFLEVYKCAARSLPTYLDAPAEVRDRGFFEVLKYWLQRTHHLVQEDWLPYRICLLGNYGTDLTIKREVNRFLKTEEGTLAFVKLGWERGELRNDLNAEMLVSILNGMVERFQDALLVEELDPGLLRKSGVTSESKEEKISQFLDILRRAIGSVSPRR